LQELIVIRLVSSLLLVFLGLSAFAQQPYDPYRVETRVANQSEAERITAAKSTLGDVIVRVTGDASAVQHPLVRQAINDAPNYLAKYTYLSEASANAATGVKLVLNYSPQAIGQLLMQAQILLSPTNGPQGIPMKIVNVQDFAAFKQVLAYLKTIAVVRRAELISVDQDVMMFNLTLDGDVSLLKSTLNGSSKLQATGNEMSSPAAPLSYSWQNY
jgi:hypothetical protein